MHKKETSRIFHVSKKKVMVLILISLAFLLTGIFMVKEDEMFGWVAIGFFVLGLPISFAMALPNSSFLLLKKDGFTIRSVYRDFKYKWSDIEKFEIIKISGVNFINMIFSDNYDKQVAGRVFARSISGSESAIQNSYKISTEKLCEILNEWLNSHKK